jgi:hypothetical protein
MAANTLELVEAPMAAPGVVGNWPLVEPVNATFPLALMASAVPLSAVGPPSSVPHICLPEGSTLITDASGQAPTPGPPMHRPPPGWVCAAPAVGDPDK